MTESFRPHLLHTGRVSLCSVTNQGHTVPAGWEWQIQQLSAPGLASEEHKRGNERPVWPLQGSAVGKRCMGQESRQARQLSNQLIQYRSSGCLLSNINVTSSSLQSFYFNCFYNSGSYLQKKMCSYFKFPLLLTMIWSNVSSFPLLCRIPKTDILLIKESS